MNRILLFFLLLGGYLGLSANLQPINLIFGVLLSAVILRLLGVRVRRADFVRLPSALWALLRYIIWLVAAVVRSGLDVARIVLTPSLPIKPGVIAVPSGSQSKLVTALSAHAMTIAPGEMVIAVDDHCVIYNHYLNVDQAEEMATAQKRRVVLLEKIFGVQKKAEGV